MARFMDMSLVFTAADNIQAEMIVEALREASIPAYKRDLGNAGIMNLYGGNSRYGENIYVAKRHVDQAKDVLAGMGLIELTD